MDFLRAHYHCLLVTFNYIAFAHIQDLRNPPGVSLIEWRNYLVMCGGQGPDKLFDGKRCDAMVDPDLIFIASNVIDRTVRAQCKIFPEKGLSRFQFLEGYARLAIRRFPADEANGYHAGKAVKDLFKIIDFEGIIVNQRKNFMRALFTEECDMVTGGYIDMIRSVYDGYRILEVLPGRHGKGLSFAAWINLMTVHHQNE